MIFIDQDKCTVCGACQDGCPRGAIFVKEGQVIIDHDLCTDCGLCLRICPEGAIYEVEPARTAGGATRESGFAPSPRPVPQPAMAARVSRPALPRPAVSPLWMGVAPLAMEVVADLAGRWLERRRAPVGINRRSAIRPGVGGRRLPAAAPPWWPGSGRRRRWRGRRGW
jgi:ferredoxin